MNDFQNAIRSHLEQRAQEDPQFAEKYRNRMKDDKNCIIQCCSYIIQEVKKMKREALTHSEVYGMAAHFFDEDIKVTANEKCRVVVSRSDMTPEEIEGIKAEAHDRMQELIGACPYDQDDATVSRSIRYRSKMKAFAGIKMKGDAFSIAPIMTLTMLKKEGELMNHCVYRNKYDKKNSIILSVRRRNRKRNRLATVEVGLDRFTILQCRGKNNSLPPYDAEIRELIGSNMNMIRNCVNR